MLNTERRPHTLASTYEAMQCGSAPAATLQQPPPEPAKAWDLGGWRNDNNVLPFCVHTRKAPQGSTAPSWNRIQKVPSREGSSCIPGGISCCQLPLSKQTLLCGNKRPLPYLLGSQDSREAAMLCFPSLVFCLKSTEIALVRLIVPISPFAPFLSTTLCWKPREPL